MFRDSLMSHVFGFKLVLASEAKDVGENILKDEAKILIERTEA